MPEETTYTMSKAINVSVQVVPLHRDPYPIVDGAIEAIAESGVKYEVGPMETVLEGELDELLEVVKAAHRACFVEGVERVITYVKIADSVSGTTIEEKVGKISGTRFTLTRNTPQTFDPI